MTLTNPSLLKTLVPYQLVQITSFQSRQMELYILILSFLLLSCIFLGNGKGLFIKKKRLPPGPNGFPLIGSLITIGDRPHESLAKLAKKYGPLMTVKFGFVNVVIASSKEMAKEILQKNDQAFLGRPVPDAVTAEKGYEHSMAWISGCSQEWKKLRKICNSQIFTSQRLDSLQDLRHKLMKNMVERVTEARDAGEAIDIGRLVFGTTLNLLANTMFSSDILGPKTHAIEELKVLIGKIMLLAGKPNLADYFPFLKPFDPQGIKREIKVSYDRLHELVGDIVDRRIEHRIIGSARSGDFLDVLLDYTEEQQGSAERLDLLDVKLLLMDNFIGGTDTTTTTLEWAMAELLHNPAILLKTKQEMSLKITPGKSVQEQDISRLPYLEAVIKETMRLHPTAPLLLPHRAEEQVEICGYTIPKHTQIFVNAWSILRDTAHWDESTIFKPERFLNSDIDFRGRDFSFIPFSAGRRICPGLNLGVRMVSLILATLVQNFDWKLPNGMAPVDMDMTDKFGVTLQRADPLVAIPVKVTSL